MGRYRKVDSRIWNDERFLSMSDDGQLAFLFLLTHPNQSACGAFRSTVESLASDKGWPPERMSAALAEAGNKVVIGDRIIWLPNFLRYNEPENPNVCIAIARGVDDLPESPTRRRVDAAVRAHLSQCRPSFTNAYDNGLRTVPSGFVESGAVAGTGTGTGAVIPSRDVTVVPDLSLQRTSTAPRENGLARRGSSEVQDACDDWTEIVGGAAPGGVIAGQWRRLLSKTSGVTWSMARPVWRWALAWHVSQGRMEFFSPGEFASKFRYWATKAVRGSGKGGLTDLEDARRFLRGSR